MKFANIHIFPFSKRRNTPVMEHLKPTSKAAHKNDHEHWEEIPGTVIRKRIGKLKILKEKLAKEYIRKNSRASFQNDRRKNIYRPKRVCLLFGQRELYKI